MDSIPQGKKGFKRRIGKPAPEKVPTKRKSRDSRKKGRKKASKRSKAQPKKKTAAASSADPLAEVTDVPAAEPVHRQPSAARIAKVQRLKARHKHLSSAEYDEARRLRADIAHRSVSEQAAWLVNGFYAHLGASELQRDGPECASHVAALPPGDGLEARLMALEPHYESRFCSTIGKQAGKPTTMYVSPAAMGCVAMIKACPSFNAKCRIEKLFAKHFRLEEQVEALQSRVACIVAGTPHRLEKLIEIGALHVGALRYIVLDVSCDVKGRTLLDMPEVRADWWKLAERLKPAFAGNAARMVLYSQAG